MEAHPVVYLNNMPNDKIIFICSPAHAGSTIMELILSGHPMISSLGEVSSLAHNIELGYPCTCGEELANCPEWSPIFEKINQTNAIKFEKNPYEYQLGVNFQSVELDSFQQRRWNRYRHHFRKAVEYLYFRFELAKSFPQLPSTNTEIKNTIALYNFARQTRKIPILVDSSKRYLKALELYADSPEKVRILFLKRDGRSIYASHLKRNWPRKIAFNAWRKFYTRATPLLEKYVDSAHMLSISFEDFLKNPTNHLEKICNLVEVETSPIKEMLMLSRENLHSAGGNWTRFSDQLVLKEDSGWDSFLSEDDLAYFKKRKGLVLNAKLGYS